MRRPSRPRTAFHIGVFPPVPRPLRAGALVIALVTGVPGLLHVTGAAASTNLDQPDAGTTGAPGTGADAVGGESIDDRFIVSVEDRGALAHVRAVLASDGVPVDDTWYGGTTGLVASMTVDDAAELRDLDGVVAVEPDRIVRGFAQQTDPPWNLDRIDQVPPQLDHTYGYARTGAGVTAYVIDSGIRASHVEFGQRVRPGYAWDFGDGQGSVDCAGHGTHVAGTLGGGTKGVARAVTLVPVKVLACNNTGTAGALIAGINWVINDHRAGTPAVANLSLGAGALTAVDNAVQALIADGVTVVVAAGNEAVPSCSVSPARVPAAITVAASTSGDEAAYFSNHGSCNDLFAPGVQVVSADFRSDAGFLIKSGTSMASPHVAGAAALVLEKQPAASPAQVWAVLQADATRNAVLEHAGDPDLLLGVPPAAPAPPTIAGIGWSSDGVHVTVQAGDDGGRPLSRYEVRVLVDSTLVRTTAAMTPELVVTGLVPGTTYTLAAAAVNAIGRSSWGAARAIKVLDGEIVPADVAPDPPPDPPSPPSAPAAPALTSVTPARVLDTRPEPTIDGRHQNIGRLPAGTTTPITITGRAGVPDDATAVILNLTAVTPDTAGYLTIYPCGSPRPLASNLNVATGAITGNTVLAKIGTNGQICIFTNTTTDLVADLNAYLPAAPALTSVTPARVLDTRPEPTIDGRHQNIGRLPAGTTTPITITGRAGVPDDATAVILNLTAVTPDTAGYLTIYPCGSPRPLASNLNVATGAITGNTVLAKIGTNGQICIFTNTTTDLVADLNAYLPAAPALTSVTPARVLDTRPEPTIDGRHQNIGRLPAGTTTPITITGRAGVPDDATAVILNLTAVTPDTAGYLTIYPCGSPRPLASNLNVATGAITGNTVLAKIGTNGQICIFTNTTTDLVADLNAYLPAAPTT